MVLAAGACAARLTARPSPYELFRLVLESHDGRALVPFAKRSASPRDDIDNAPVDDLKALDPNRPIIEKPDMPVACNKPLDPKRT